MPATETSPLAAERQRLPCVSFGPFAFDTHTRLLRRGGQEVALPPRVLGVLELLLQRAGDVVSRQELIDTVWKDAFVTDTSLAEAVSVLRQALADDPQSPTYIQTLHRRGYRFVAPVSTAERRQAGTAGARIDAPGVEPVVSPSIGGQLVPWSAAVICALIAAAAVWQLTRDGQAASTPAARFAVTPAARDGVRRLGTRARLLRRRHAARLVGLRRRAAAGSTSGRSTASRRRSCRAPRMATRPSFRPTAGGLRSSPADGSRKWRSPAVPR